MKWSNSHINRAAPYMILNVNHSYYPNIAHKNISTFAEKLIFVMFLLTPVLYGVMGK